MLQSLNFIGRLLERVTRFVKTVSYTLLLMAGFFFIGGALLLGFLPVASAGLNGVLGVAVTAMGCILGTAVMSLSLVKLIETRLAAERARIEGQVRDQIALDRRLGEGEAAKQENRQFREDLARHQAMRVKMHDIVPGEKLSLLEVRFALIDHARKDAPRTQASDDKSGASGAMGSLLKTASGWIDKLSREERRIYQGVLRLDYTARIGVELDEVRVSKLPDGRLHVSNWKPRQLGVDKQPAVFEICEIRRELLMDESESNIRGKHDVLIEEFILPSRHRSSDLHGHLQQSRETHEQEIRQRVDSGTEQCDQLARQLIPYAKLRIEQMLAFSGRELLFEQTDGIVGEGALPLAQFLNLEAQARRVDMLPALPGRTAPETP